MIALIIAVLAVSVLMVLLFPATILVNSRRSQGKIDGSFSISWIIFHFRYALKEKQLEILILGRKIFHHIFSEKKPPEPGQVKQKKSKKPRRMPPVRDLSNMTQPVLRLFKDLFNAFRLRYFDVNITFGLSDPAYTGFFTGLMHAVRSSFGMGQNIRFEPDFTAKVMDWKFRAEASITLFGIVIPFVKFAASRQVLRLALKSIQ